MCALWQKKHPCLAELATTKCSAPRKSKLPPLDPIGREDPVRSTPEKGPGGKISKICAHWPVSTGASSAQLLLLAATPFSLLTSHILIPPEKNFSSVSLPRFSSFLGSFCVVSSGVRHFYLHGFFSPSHSCSISTINSQ